jgi:hypothetical protein
MLPTGGLFRRTNRSRSQESARRHRRNLVLQGSLNDWSLEERCLLTTGKLLPTPTVDSLGDVFYDGVTGAFQKTITITNNSPTQTIYVFLEGENSRVGTGIYSGTSQFDPYDPANQEYRGYIGYLDGEDKVAGLPPSSTITVTVPLVFWDSGRIIFSTDGTDQFSTYSGTLGVGSPTGAPFNYLDTNAQATYLLSIDSGNPNQLNFVPAYNSFDTAAPHNPTKANWQSPVASGELVDGQEYLVSGPGIPASGFRVTIRKDQPNSVILSGAPAPQKEPVQGYTFTPIGSSSISDTARFIQGGFTLTKQGTAPTNDGLVMWYHALKPQAPNNDAPFQLTEFTFRGTFYDPAINATANFLPLLGKDDLDGAKVDSADYDISFVDTINLPVAMEATNATIPNSGGQQAPFGWVGSSQSLADFQKALKDLTSTNTKGNNLNSLGQYFDGKGFPSYLLVQPDSIKLPAGQNVFLASPTVLGGTADIFLDKTFSDNSVLHAPLFALTSGATAGPGVFAIGGDSQHPIKGTTLGLRTNDSDQYILNNFVGKHPSWYAVSFVNQQGKTINLGTVKSLAFTGGKLSGVILNKPVPADATSNDVYTFTLVAPDYAASQIAGLWYSWARYYAQNVKSTAMTNVAGTVSDGNIVTLAKPAAGLVPGMAVTAANGAALPPGCVILSVSPNKRTIELSTVVTGNTTAFNFAKPSFNSIVGYDPSQITLVNFSFDTPKDKAFALGFAQTVYTVMSAWSVSVKQGTANGWNPLMVNIIGGNLGKDYLPNANTDVVVALTDLSKSALRGVPDFTSPLYSDPAQWYPDPAISTGGKGYNVFNLNPFVWFIHEKLGLTAYAFALDDDIGNVEAGGANNIAISIGGLNGLPNKDPYTTPNNWGVVTTTVPSADKNSSILGGNLGNPDVARQAGAYNYNKETYGSLVNGPGVQMGTAVQFLPVNDEKPEENKVVMTQPLTAASSGKSFALFGSMVFTGTVFGNGQAANTLILNSPDAYNTLLKIGPLQNIQVTGEGIDPTKPPVTIVSMVNKGGVVTITLSRPLERSRVSKANTYYAYTFGAPAIATVRDGGFEWTGVGDLTGLFNHGDQVTQNTKDWTFTDGGANNTAPFAGIAFGNESTFTEGNPVPPQALQVGFIQGKSTISQVVTLASGSYTLSLLAAQSAVNQGVQSLNVLVDNKVVGTVKPKGTKYDKFTFTFPIVGTGKHTITFVGTATASDPSKAPTVLIDSVACNLKPPTLAHNPGPPSVELGTPITKGASLRDTGSVVANSVSSTATVSYGDGTGVHRLPLSPIGTFKLAHTYTRTGTFVVTVSARNSTGAVDIEKFTVRATVVPLVSGFGVARDGFVTSLYRENLGRLPDPNSLKSLSRRLAAGASPRAVAMSVWGSAEHKTLVKRGVVPPITFQHTLADALRTGQRAGRLHQPPPLGPLALTVIKPPS